MIKSVTVKNITQVEKGLINKRTIENFPEQPMHECPRCGLLIPDFDGFGVLDHVSQPDEKWPPPCGYCSHPALDGDICSICGARKGSREYSMAKIP